MGEIGIIGTGGFAREVLCLIDDLGLYEKVVGFYEPDNVWEDQWKNKKIMDKSVLPYSDIKDKYELSIAIGSPQIRKKVANDLGSNVRYGSYMHPSATVSRWANLGNGAIVTANCVITSQIEIGDHCQLNLQTTIGHDCKIGNFFTSAPAVNISGICNIGDGVYFGTGSATRQSIDICDDVIIGMGAMVVKNITEQGIYVGIPAKKKS